MSNPVGPAEPMDTGLSYLTMVAATPSAENVPPSRASGAICFANFKERDVREQGVWKF
jgi:hypothetical protein